MEVEERVLATKTAQIVVIHDATRDLKCSANSCVQKLIAVA